MCIIKIISLEKNPHRVPFNNMLIKIFTVKYVPPQGTLYPKTYVVIPLLFFTILPYKYRQTTYYLD